MYNTHVYMYVYKYNVYTLYVYTLYIHTMYVCVHTHTHTLYFTILDPTDKSEELLCLNSTKSSQRPI